jgi:hypothetical protein
LGVVAVLKALDTFVTLCRVSPPNAIFWVLMIAFFVSPKGKQQIGIFAAIVWFHSKGAINLSALFGAWFGVMAFAAVFGISAGMAVGTIVGFVRARGVATAPDALGEGSKPAIWGLTVPLTVFVVAAIAYFLVLMLAVIKMLQH